MSYSRTNDSHSADIDKTKIFASGAFKNVWKGTYTVGSRKGQPCVAKEFKTGSVYDEHYFEEELNIIRRTQIIIDDFHAARIIDKTIFLNTPQIWTYNDDGTKTLVEPLILNFEKFNSNTGWASLTGDAWSKAMQALSHFSYHKTNGQLLLCDLQGGMYQDGYVLSDPVIMSQAQSHGPADLGPRGIESFFHRHRCSEFCNRNWMKPRVVGVPLFPVREGTTMLHLTARPTRAPLSRLREEGWGG